MQKLSDVPKHILLYFLYNVSVKFPEWEVLKT